VTLRPARLNATIAWLFMVGSACFVLGSVPAYVNAVDATTDAVTFFVGSIFFTAASFAQLLQAQSPTMAGVDEAGQHTRAPVRLWSYLPHDRAWLAALTQFPGTLFFNVSTFAVLAHNVTAQEEDQNIWRPDFFGSTLFLVASTFGILAVGGRFLSIQLWSWPWRIAWINMVGSVFFMASALASYVLPSTDELLDQPLAVAGTLVGALCFLAGAAFMFPAWRQAVLGHSTPDAP
jgi:YrhK-like protein